MKSMKRKSNKDKVTIEPKTQEQMKQIQDELKRIEEKEAEEDAKADSQFEDDEDVIPMTQDELNQFIEQKETKAAEIPVAQVKPKIQPITKKTPKPAPKQNSIISQDKTLLYSQPTLEQWKKIHELKPKKIIFYYTMTKEEYKEFFLCQVKYGSKIIGSTGARVI